MNYRTNSAAWFLWDENNSGSAGGGATPPAGGAPASTPTPAVPGAGAAPASPSPAPDPSPSSFSDSFAGFDDSDLDSIDLGDVAAAGTDPGAVTPPVPAPLTAPATPAAPAPQVPPAAQPAPAVAEPAAASQAAPRLKVESFLSDISKDENITALSDWAAANPFKLSEAEAAALDTDAMSVIPKLMGRVYAQALKSAASMIQNFAPEIAQNAIQSHSATSTKSAEANQEFYQSNPELNAKDHQALVDRWAKAFRAQNPKASRKEAIAFVGRAVKVELGIANAAPAARAAPFAPARPGGRQPIPTEQQTAWDGLDFDFDADQ